MLIAWSAPPAGANWADWIAAIGTAGAFLGSLVILRITLVDRNRSQARLVHAFVSGLAGLRRGEPAPPEVAEGELNDADYELVFPEDPDGPVEELIAKRALHLWVIVIENNSDEIVTDVTAAYEFRPKSGRSLESFDLGDLDFLPPHSRVTRYASVAMSGTSNSGRRWATVDFTDAAGRRWHRDSRKPLKRRWRRWSRLSNLDRR